MPMIILASNMGLTSCPSTCCVCEMAAAALAKKNVFLDFDVLLITSVQEYPVIWNKSLEDYKIPDVQNNAWKKIYAVMLEKMPSLDKNYFWSDTKILDKSVFIGS